MNALASIPAYLHSYTSIDSLRLPLLAPSKRLACGAQRWIERMRRGHHTYLVSPSLQRLPRAAGARDLGPWSLK